MNDIHHIASHKEQILIDPDHHCLPQQPQIEQQLSESQKPNSPDCRNFETYCPYENEAYLDLIECRINGAPTGQYRKVNLMQGEEIHIGLLDASPFPNPNNEKTKIALVGSYLRRVPLSYREPEAANRPDQTDAG